MTFNFCPFSRFTPTVTGCPAKSGPDPQSVWPSDAPPPVRGVQTPPIPTGLYSTVPADDHEGKVCTDTRHRV